MCMKDFSAEKVWFYIITAFQTQSFSLCRVALKSNLRGIYIYSKHCLLTNLVCQDIN